MLGAAHGDACVEDGQNTLVGGGRIWVWLGDQCCMFWMSCHFVAYRLCVHRMKRSFFSQVVVGAPSENLACAKSLMCLLFNLFPYLYPPLIAVPFGHKSPFLL